MIGYALALVLTLAAEVPLVVLLSGSVERRSVLAGAVAVNLLSHPLATLAWEGQAGSYVAIEAGVVLVEAVLYAGVVGLRPGRAALVAVLANAVTIGLAFVV